MKFLILFILLFICYMLIYAGVDIYITEEPIQWETNALIATPFALIFAGLFNNLSD